ncbi:hypothetical protein [Actinomadura rubrisoli]|uniref:Uncharacterized protein n=1 Tax=Actinomadura rubrisoli TaxID=2530368 RepID=A0A4R5A8K6_9ACTN|nr:hypothetical protein [Actinomadura rubrisoli]TDD66002.1 hypothetical protein E1298_40815 [Actinomadura rubrisoli]
MNATIPDAPEIRFLTSGEVSDAERAAAERAVRSALAAARGTATSVQVTLSVVPDPSLPRPALARAVAVLDGHRLRAQAAAPRLEEAIALLRDRLAVRTSHLEAAGGSGVRRRGE